MLLIGANLSEVSPDDCTFRDFVHLNVGNEAMQEERTISLDDQLEHGPRISYSFHPHYPT